MQYRTIPLTEKKRKLSSFFLIVIFSVCSRFWTFQGIPVTIFDILDVLVISIIGFQLLVLSPKNEIQPQTKFYWYTWGVLAIPLISSIPAYFIHEQSFVHSALVQRTILYWVLYFFLHLKKPAEQTIMISVLVVALIWSTINIAQQITYPRFWFYRRLSENLESPIEYRAGVYRFRIPGAEYSVIATLYYLTKLLDTRKWKHAVLICILLAGIYFNGTRQILLSTFLSCALLTLLTSAQNLRKYIPIGVAISAATAIAAIMFWDSLFREIFELTLDQASSDNIRFTSFRYFVFEHWDHWINPILGNGMPHNDSAYGQFINSLKYSRIFQSDIGIFGAFSIYGIIYVIFVLASIIAVFRTKNQMQHNYIKAFFFYTALALPLSSQFTAPQVIPLYCCLFYLLDGKNDPQANKQQSLIS